MSYQSDHLAWKQRVAQELSRATQFKQVVDSFYQRATSSGKPDQTRYTYGSQDSAASKYSYLSSISNNPKLRQFFDENSYKNAKLNMAYSFGGRLHAANTFKTTVKDANPVLSRSSTAGSLRTRRSFKLTKAENATSTSNINPTEQAPGSPKSYVSRKSGLTKARSASRNSHRPSKSLILSKSKELDLLAKQENTKTAEELERDLLPANDEKPQEEELADTVNDLENLRPATAISWKTTSSQRRYISELERLLMEERKRREELEEKVNLILERSAA